MEAQSLPKANQGKEQPSDLHYKVILAIFPVLLAGYLLLMIPGPHPAGPVNKAGNKPFAWNRDDLWNGLEKTFLLEKATDPQLRKALLIKLKDTAETLVERAEKNLLPPDDTVFASLLYNFFSMAPVVAAGREQNVWFISYYNRVRKNIKLQSQHWDMNSVVARNTIYKLLYGMRAAVEEVLLQSPGMAFNPAMFIKDEPSATPQAEIFGITVHSGDLLVSRGGAVVSALISRGNDYPGNFSHVALIYVEEKTHKPYLVEAHIERGVAISSVKHYIADKKLRFMVMRPRSDLPLLTGDPMIPQKAAEYIYIKALSKHIPYDFKMDLNDTSAMFCSEVGFRAYEHYRIHLWRAISTISSPRIVNLLNEFGVENFVTLMPSDLEYDPQLSVVAEWRDPQTLFKDHVYNAVMDIILENTANGEEIRINPWMLPFARLAKGYSVLLNLFNKEGPVPEGMSATQGLKNKVFENLHAQIRQKTELKIKQFIEKNGYVPPYWQILAMARESYQPQILM
ncbi:MAG: YiiX/YebB-like N1pC/P60 family cysteine hydrolase [Bacteroidetes bacterium]|nr:YiiX/YebB-like N1pC/P60 family cysteine hydrolase [Bacteroidota bacterium]